MHYWDVWNHVTSWQGAEAIITRRLNRLINEKDPLAIEQLVNEAKTHIDYLYQGAGA